jgi:membrane-associated phospholipid phosphatase
VGIIAAELALLIATVVMVVIVKAHPGPLPGDAGLTVWWQHLVRPRPLPRAVLDDISAVNWPIPAAITIAVFAVVFALLRRWLAVLVLLAMELADLTNFIINEFVRRPRPAGYGVFVDRHITTNYSFPSGHVEHALAILGIVVFLSFQVRRPAPWLNVGLWVVRIGLLAMIVLMSPSRVMQGEHWPSDGLAGLFWGGLWLLIGIQIYTWAAQRWPRLVPLNERKEIRPAT